MPCRAITFQSPADFLFSPERSSKGGEDRSTIARQWEVQGQERTDADSVAMGERAVADIERFLLNAGPDKAARGRGPVRDSAAAVNGAVRETSSAIQAAAGLADTRFRVQRVNGGG
jgi:hypothetical protein